MINFYDLTFEEQIKIIEVMRQRDLDNVSKCTYNPIQYRINSKAINIYYKRLIKELSKNNSYVEEIEELSKVA